MALGPRISVPFPFNTENKYEDEINIFPGPKFVFPGWRCPL